VLIRGAKANADLTAIKIGTLLKGTAEASVDIERVRQELPADVSAFEVVEFRICAQYGNEVLTKKEYHAFTTQIIPAYQNRPPEKPVPNDQPTQDSSSVAAAHRGETCGPVPFKTRSRERFIRSWVSHINDLLNLMAVMVEPRPLVEEGRISKSILIQEAFFTLKCLEKDGQLRTATPDHPSMVWGLVENQRIIFLKPTMTTPE
jgi:hypothetical protein